MACAEGQSRPRGLMDLYREQERFGELANTLERLVDLTTEMSRLTC